MQRSKAGRQPGSPSWEFPTGGLSWHPACFPGSCPAPLPCRRAASTLPFSCTQLVYIKKLSPVFRTVWVCPENRWSVTASVVQPPSAPSKTFHLFGCVFCMAPMVYCPSDSKIGMCSLPDPCKVEKFCYSHITHGELRQCFVSTDFEICAWIQRAKWPELCLYGLEEKELRYKLVLLSASDFFFGEAPWFSRWESKW